MSTGSRFAGWRVALRLARREAWRRKGQTLLMLVLIGLPVVAVSAAAIVWRTADVSPVEGIARRMGSADALVEADGSKRVLQCPDPSDCSMSVGQGAAGGVPGTAEVQRLLGRRPVLPMLTDMAQFPTDHGVGELDLVEVDLTDPMTDGLFRLHQGRLPRTTGEVVIDGATADRGPAIGDTLPLTRKTPHGPRTYRLKVVGIADYANSRSDEVAGVLPGALPLAQRDGGTQGIGGDAAVSWLVGGGPVSWTQVRALNRTGLLVTSRQVLGHPPTEAELPPQVQAMRDEGPVDATTVTVIALVAVMVLLEVILLAGPAFAVRARAQAHTLALVAAAGGTPAQARRTILACGVVIGTAGGVLGVVLGVGLGRVAVPVAQQHSTDWFGPFEVPWLLLLAVAGVGLLSAVLAAVVPAVAASRHDVVAVLAGRRGEGRPSRRSPWVGLALIAAGVVGAVAGSGGQGGSQAAVLIAGSALVSVVGMIFLVPVAVVVLARLASRFPLALRFAARDAARHRMRTVPAVAAVGATVAGVVALGIALSSQDANDARDYSPQLAVGWGAVSLSRPGDLRTVTATVRKEAPDVRLHAVTGLAAELRHQLFTVDFRTGGEVLGQSFWGALGTGDLVSTTVPAYLGLDPAVTARADATLHRGGVVLLQSKDSARASGTAVTVVAGRSKEDGSGSTRLARLSVPMTLVPVGTWTAPVGAIVPPRTAARLHVPVVATALTLAPTVDRSTQQDLTEALAADSPDSSLYVERGYHPPSSVWIVQLVLGALGAVLMLGGTLTATFLALSDARPDLATMAAVGARPRTRRFVAAAYALAVGLLGALLGTPIGFIPGIAISAPLTRTDGGSTVLDIPWLLIIGIVVGLPLVTAAALGLCARSRLPLVARID